MPVKFFWCKTMTFKKNKKNIFYLLVSDHVVTLNCFTVRADFFDFPIDFFWGLPPSLYADEVLCAACRAALPPHMLFVFRKNRKWRNSMQVHETLFLCNRYALPPHILFLWRKIIDISLQKKWKRHVNENCENWVLVRTRAQLLQLWGAPKWPSKSTLNANMTSTFFLRRDKIWQKNHTSSKFQNFRSNWHWHAHKITQKVFTISITLECAKIVTFSEKC